MAFLKQAKTEDEIKKLTVAGVKKSYNELAQDYNKLINLDYIYCPQCNDFITRNNFYKSNDTPSGINHTGCKKCLLKSATDYDKKNGIYKDNKQKAKKTLMLMDLPFIEDVYDAALADVINAVNEKNRGTAWQQYMVMIQSLPQYRGLHWENSEFKVNSEYDDEYEVKENQKIIKKAKKRFGPGYSNEDYMFLENEYQDWVTRYECNTKAQEEIFVRLSQKKLEIRKATTNGQPTKDLDKTYQELLNSGNVLPKQVTLDTMSDAQTLGTLIQKYEETRPLPEIDPELEDVDKIGLYIDSFYRGHASKMLGLKNRFSNLYEKVMSKYTVKPPEYDDETDTEAIFEKIFGSIDDE